MDGTEAFEAGEAVIETELDGLDDVGQHQSDAEAGQFNSSYPT